MFLHFIAFFALLLSRTNAQPKPKPKGRPEPDMWCAEVLMYDLFGDGWGENVSIISRYVLAAVYSSSPHFLCPLRFSSIRITDPFRYPSLNLF